MAPYCCNCDHIPLDSRCGNAEGAHGGGGVGGDGAGGAGGGLEEPHCAKVSTCVVAVATCVLLPCANVNMRREQTRVACHPQLQMARLAHGKAALSGRTQLG